MTPSLRLAPPKLEYGRNTYTQLSGEQQSSIYEEISKRCLSLDTLLQQRHILEDKEPPTNIMGATDLGIHNFVSTPKRYPSIPRRKVVAIACQWGMNKSHRGEPLAICAIDFLTGETLINSLVSVSQPLSDWRSDIHGIREKTINAAVKRGECLQGWREARAKLFEYIDEQTVLVGHFTRCPLELLRLFHTTIVDSQVLATSAICIKNWPMKKGYKPLLYNICKDFLGITIRQNSSSYQNVVENALASREIILHCIQRPQDWEKWARLTRVEFSQLQERNSKVKKNGDSDPSPHKQQSAFPIQDESQIAAAYDDGYDDGYDAAYRTGFQTGFQKGYEEGYEKANVQRDQNLANKGDLDRSQYGIQNQGQALNQNTDGADTFDDQDGRAGQNGSGNDDGDPAEQTGGLLAQLMKDDRIREMAQKISGSEGQNVARGADKAHMKDFLVTSVQEAKKEEVSRRARIQAKLDALGSWKKAPEEQSAQKNGENGCVDGQLFIPDW